MSATKWTKGPWHKNINATYPIYSGNNPEQITHVAVALNIDNKEQREANANIMAAAPELYDALQMLLQAIPSKRDWLDPDVEKYAHLILRKARGEQN